MIRMSIDNSYKTVQNIVIEQKLLDISTDKIKKNKKMELQICNYDSRSVFTSAVLVTVVKQNTKILIQNILLSLIYNIQYFRHK